jgi:hypothetical protein
MILAFSGGIYTMRYYVSAAAILFFFAAIPAEIPAANAATVLTFDDLPDLAIVSNQYSGVTITGASVLTKGVSLNPVYPPVSTPNVVYNYLNEAITLDFTTDVGSIGGYVTGLGAVTLTAYDGAAVLGSVATSGPNSIGSGKPNTFLSLAFGHITSAVFSTNLGYDDTFTLDNVTIGGAGMAEAAFTTNGVPEPATWAMLVVGFGVTGGAMRGRRKVRVTYA